MASKNPAINSPLLENDTIISVNGIQLIEVEGGVDAWVKIFASFSDMPREVVVSRSAAADVASSIARQQIMSNDNLTTNFNSQNVSRPMAPDDIAKMYKQLAVKPWSDISGRIGAYKAGVIVAITELKDRSGSSSIAIKKYMQASISENKKWKNDTFLSTMKKMVVDGDLVQVKASYKLSASYKANLSESRRAEITKQREVEWKQQQNESNKAEAARRKEIEAAKKQEAQMQKKKKAEMRKAEAAKRKDAEMKKKKEAQLKKKKVAEIQKMKAAKKKEAERWLPRVSLSPVAMAQREAEMKKACRENILEVLKERGGETCIGTIMAKSSGSQVIKAVLADMVTDGELVQSGSTYKLLRVKASVSPALAYTAIVVGSKVEPLNAGWAPFCQATVTINKPSKESKIGIGIEQKAGGPIGVTFIAPDSVFVGTPVTAGLVLEFVNGIKCTNCVETISLMKETVGPMTVVAVGHESMFRFTTSRSIQY